MKPSIKDIILDFDGTIMAYDGELAFIPPKVVELLNGLRERGVCWHTNSGRNMEGQVRILNHAVENGLHHVPEGLMCSETKIFRRRNGSYLPVEPWNSDTQHVLVRFHAQVQSCIAGQINEWRIRYEPDITYLEKDATVFRVEDEDDKPRQLQEELARAISTIPDASAIRNGAWVAAIPDSLGKGRILKNYLETHGISPKYALAIGDHHNDLSMLDGTIVDHVGCPSNAIKEVIETVQSSGGIVADGEGPAGTIEIIEHYLG